jgi:hypothetical protein
VSIHPAEELNSTQTRRQVMVTKLVSLGKKAMRRKATTAASELTESSAIALLESRQTATAGSTSLDPDVRRQLVAAEAYFLAERRGFAAGHELEDWVAAEAAVDSRRREMQAA